MGNIDRIEEIEQNLQKKNEEIENSSTRLILYGPLTSMQYTDYFSMGDIDEIYWPYVINDCRVFNGKWQIVLGRSESVEEIMRLLEIPLLKRKIINNYASTTDLILYSDKSKDEKNPFIEIATYLPLNNVKRSTIAFDNTWTEQEDNDTGVWKTLSVFINGRALQRRENKNGVMFDVRCIFEKDPIEAISEASSLPSSSSIQAIQGPVQLFKWTFIPKGKDPVTAHRWMKKIS